MQCDNKSNCHTPLLVNEDDNAMRVICTTCKQTIVIRKDYRGVPFNRQYSEVFKKDILQGKDNLFYKYHPEYLQT